MLVLLCAGEVADAAAGVFSSFSSFSSFSTVTSEDSSAVVENEVREMMATGCMSIIQYI